MKTMYTARATTTGGGRDKGHGRSEDGVLDMVLTTPKELGGDGARGSNPEQLFALGYSACFLGALRAAGRKTGIGVPDDASVTADIGFTDREDKEGFWIRAALSVSLPGLDAKDAEALVAAAHTICPYSEVSRKGFPVEVSLV